MVNWRLSEVGEGCVNEMAHQSLSLVRLCWLWAIHAKVLIVMMSSVMLQNRECLCIGIFNVFARML